MTIIRMLGVAAFVCLMAMGAWANIPMYPVPMTMQSFAVLLAGLCLGPIGGLLAVLAYLLLAFTGLPILSDGASGPAPFTGPTAGYIYAFAIIAYGAGWMARWPFMAAPLPGIAALFALHVALLAAGTAWLCTVMPLSTALSVGFTPFLIGAVVKSLLCWGTWKGLEQLKRGGTG